ncbi:MAG TPA: glycosyltransferase family 9 protein [Thermoanaerobaculia bacterium]|nr:glycosyltransferase family 9 protein [Thermoanaerobaculia bacterium]
MNVVIVRLSAMGDVIHSLPLAANLARAGHRVAWAVEKPFAPLLAGNPSVALVIDVQTRRWRRRPWRSAAYAEIGSARSALRAFGADAVLDPQGNEKSWAVAQFARAPRVVLDDRSVRGNWTRRLSAVRVRPGDSARHVTDRVMALLAPLGVPVRKAAPDARYLLAGEHREADAFLARLPRSFALYHPGAGWANKSWGEERFAALAERVRTARGISPVVSWGPGDEPRAEALSRRLGAPSIPPLDFRGLARVAAGAAFFAAGDTGPLHLADALGVPTVALFGPTDPVRNGPYRRNGVEFSSSLRCAPCNDRYRETKPCLAGTSPEDVARAVFARFPAA